MKVEEGAMGGEGSVDEDQLSSHAYNLVTHWERHLKESQQTTSKVSIVYLKGIHCPQVTE